MPIAPSTPLATAWERWLALGRDAVAALDRLPPIRLPVGPPVAWRYALPALVALVVVIAVMARPSPSATAAGDALLTQATPGLGVADPPGLGFDPIDLGVKLLLVIGLAYGSLLALKRLGFAGAVPSSTALPPGETLRLLNSLTIAPNRSVHLIRGPGGKLLIVGSTPQQVNLIADLGERPDLALDDAPVSFLQVLSDKIASSSRKT